MKTQMPSDVKMDSHSLAHKPVMAAVYTILFFAVYQCVLSISSIVSIGSYNLTSAEVVLVVTVGACVYVASKQAVALSGSRLIMLMLAGLAFLSFSRGFLDDPFAASVMLRSTGVLIAVMILGAIAPREPRLFDAISRALINTGRILGVLVFLRLIFGPSLFMLTGHQFYLGFAEDGRPIVALGAFIIAGAAILSLSLFVRGRSAKDGWGAAFCFLSLLLSGQATAFMAGALGCVIILACEKGASLGGRQIASGLVLLFCLALVIVAQMPGVADNAPAFIQNLAQQRNNTFSTRQAIWSGLTADFQTWGIADQLLGLPANLKPKIYLLLWNGSFWNRSIHSMYFGSLVYMGLLGAASYVAMLLAGIVSGLGRLSKGVAIRGDTAAQGIALCVLCAVYGYSYELRNSEIVFFMLAMWAAFPQMNKKINARQERPNSGAAIVSRVGRA